MKDVKRFLPLGMIVFLTVAAILLFYDTLFGSRAIVTLGEELWEILQPILYGVLFAYMLTPLVNFLEGMFFQRQIQAAVKNGNFCSRSCRVVSILAVWVLVFFVLYLLLSVLLPELADSVLQLMGNLENYYNTVAGWVDQLFRENPELESRLVEELSLSYQELISLVSSSLAPQARQLMSMLSGGIVTAVNFTMNLIVGIIVATYLMATKEQAAAHCRKLLCAILPRNGARWLFIGFSRANTIFSGFVRGKLLDSLIIGLICFIGCSVLNMPYTPLVSVFVGITNVIPFFGPFLGAVPSLFLILLVNPLKALYFLIFVLALQQLDGNVIGPKILGNKTGLSSFWVIAAILVGGGFFGVLGMFFGVPVFACVQTLFRFLSDVRLQKLQLPLEDIRYRTGIPEVWQETGKTEKSGPENTQQAGE